MQPFMVTEFISAIRAFQIWLVTYKCELKQLGDSEAITEEAKKHLIEQASALETAAHKLKFKRLTQSTHDFTNKIKDGPSRRMIIPFLEDLLKEAREAMREHHFAYIQPDVTEFFEQDKLFGNEVYDAYPSMRQEIKEAGNCIACELPTAAIFHLMRVVEFGLRLLAKKLKIKIKHPIDHSEWRAIITGCENKIKILQNGTRGNKRIQQLEFYQTCLSEFNAFKDVWRNRVSHSSKSYTRREALDVMDRVKIFITKLATKLKESGLPK